MYTIHKDDDNDEDKDIIGSMGVSYIIIVQEEQDQRGVACQGMAGPDTRGDMTSSERHAVRCNAVYPLDAKEIQHMHSSSWAARYSPAVVTQCLQFMGCKARRARKVCNKVFWLLTQRSKEHVNDTERCVMVLDRGEFERVVLFCLGEHPRQVPQDVKLEHFRIACRVIERKLGLVVLLCGTSGTGKSTLASLVASRLGISHVISSDAIRNILRGFDEDREHEYLWSSTYEHDDVYAKQRDAILKHVESLIAAFASRRESIVIEGVHLSAAFALDMAKKYPHAKIVPFFIHISNKQKHLERFAVRAKAMTLRPENNRYVQYLESIRSIQHLLQKEAKVQRIPQVDNTNIDRSLDVIHTTILGMLSNDASRVDMRTRRGGSLLAIFESTVTSTWKSSVAMEQISRQKSNPLGGSPVATSYTSTLSEGGGSRMMDDSDHDSLKNASDGPDDESMVHGSVNTVSDMTKSDMIQGGLLLPDTILNECYEN